MKKILQKINSIRLCMEAHPDNEPDSEFADRIEDLKELPRMMEEYVSQFKPKWIKIESEEDLPKEGMILVGNSKTKVAYTYVSDMSILIDRQYIISHLNSGNITHYMLYSSPPTT